MPSAWRRLARQARRQRETYRWVLAYLRRRGLASLVLLVVSAALGLAALSVGASFVVAVVASLETGRSPSVRGVSLGPVSPDRLPVLAGIAAAAIGVGAALVFASRSSAVHIASRVQVWLVRDVLEANAGRFTAGVDYLDDAAVHRAVLRLLRTDPNRMSLALRRGLELPVNVGVAAIGTIALVVVDAPAALATLAFLVAAMPVYYRLNLTAVRSSKDLERVHPEAQEAAKRVQRLYARMPWNAGSRLASDPAATEPITRAADAFRQRFAAVLRADLTSQLLTALALLGLLLYLGGAAFGGSIPFTLAVTFIALVRIVLGAIRSLFNTVTFVSRYFPALYRLQAYVRFQRAPGGRDPGPVEVRVPKSAMCEKGRRTVVLDTRSILHVWTPFEPSRFTNGFFLDLLTRHVRSRGDPEWRWSLALAPSPSAPNVPATVADLFGGRVGTPPTLVDADRRALDAGGVSAPDAVVDEASWATVSRSVWCRVAFAMALAVGSSAVVTTSMVMAAVTRARVPESRRPALTLVWTRRPPAPGPGLRLVAAADGSVVAFGSDEYLHRHWRTVMEAVARRHGELRKTDQPIGDDEDSG